MASDLRAAAWRELADGRWQMRVNPTGRLGIAGVFTSADTAPAQHGRHVDGSMHVPWATLFSKGVTVGLGALTIAGTPRTCVT